MANEDGSMSAEEYLRRAAELQADQVRLNKVEAAIKAARQAVVSRTRQSNLFEQADRERSPLQEAMQRAFDGKFVELSYSHGVPAMGTSPGEGPGMPDLVITDVHNLPTRVCPSPQANSRAEMMTRPMQEQVNSGRYPTVEDHLAGRTPVYEPTVDRIGNTHYRELTEEELTALRNRASTNTER